MELPELFDLSRESDATHALYGLERGSTRGFAWQCLVARRLAERGVRFIELIDSGSSDNWDAHGDMTLHGPLAANVDRPIAGLLNDLRQRRESGELAFDRVIIETTGLADPGPVAQTFFLDDEIADAFLLDAVITVVDARHGNQQLDEHKEAVEQVGFADRILMSKVDIAPEADREALRQRLVRINPRAPIRPVNFGDADIADILDIRGFNLNAILEIDPQFLTSDEHEHDEAVQSFVYRSVRAFDPVKLEDFLGGIIQVYGQDMLRYKGVLFMKGSDRQTVFQGVHQMMGADMGRKWQPGEKRSSKMVFIGRNLPKDMFIKGLEQCLA
jgi:G3E family GTPase